jgi:Nickel responsive protein SCO4226-like
MVYVVERYLPGLHRSDLLRGLSTLTQLSERAGEERVSYLGSTIVLGDEACYCRFEARTEAAVAEANRQAGLPFNRIVPALTVNPKGEQTVSISPSIRATVEIGRGRFFGLVAAVAVLAAAVTWVLVAVAFDNGNSTAASSGVQLKPIASRSFYQPKPIASLPSAAADARRVPSIMTLTPARLAAGALGTGYALPTKHHGPTVASVLASMSPQTRQYTKAIMDLTFAQLAAGAAGSP